MNDRSKALYSTDAAAALGLSKYRSPVQLWMEKTGLKPGDDDQIEREEVKMGLVMQPVIGRLYEDRVGVKLRDISDFELSHPTVPWMRSHFDFEIDRKRHLVEAKNFNINRMKEFGEEGSPDVPWDCLVQCAHEAAVFEADVVDVAVLFGGQFFRIYTIPIENTLIESVIEKERSFWQLVESKTPPPVRTEEDAKTLYTRDDGTEVIATPEIEEACAILANAKNKISALESVKEDAEAAIKMFMEERSSLRSRSGKLLATWNKSKDSRVLDAKTFKAQMPGIYEQFTIDREGSRRFLLKI